MRCETKNKQLIEYIFNVLDYYLFCPLFVDNTKLYYHIRNEKLGTYSFNLLICISLFRANAATQNNARH